MRYAFMKPSFTSFPILAATLFASATLHAGISPEFRKQVEEIRQLLKPAETDTPEAKKSKSGMRNLTIGLQAMVDQGELSHFSRYTAENLGEGFASIPGLAEKLEELRLSAQQEVLRRNQSELEAGEALIKEVGELLLSAKKPEELDGLLLKLSNQKPSDYQGNPKLAMINRQIQTASQIVGNWQEYLIAKESGNRQTQMSHLQQVSSALSSNPIIPRSLVLRLLSPSAPQTTTDGSEPAADAVAITIDSITTALTESGDAATAVKELKELPVKHLKGSHDMSVLGVAQSIETLRMLEPSMTDAEVIANTRTLYQNQQNRLIYNRALDQIVLNSIARKFAIEAPSAKMTTPRKVVEALAESAAKSQDWPQLRKAISTMESLAYGLSSPEPYKRGFDLRILSLFELAKAAEDRNDVEAAATAYVEASNLDGFYLPKDVAYGKLADLKQKSPDKLEPILAKAEERRQRTEAARHAAELEARDRRMNQSMMGGRPDIAAMNIAAMKPLVQEVVAEFLKEKRLEAAARKPENGAAKPNGTQAKPEHTVPGKD